MQASRASVTHKIVRPTYDEQFSLPEEFIVNDREKKHELKFDAVESSSVGSLKDSGYRYVSLSFTDCPTLSPLPLTMMCYL